MLLIVGATAAAALTAGALIASTIDASFAAADFGAAYSKPVDLAHTRTEPAGTKRE